MLMKKAMIAILPLALAACGSGTPSIKLPGDYGKDRISVGVYDAPAGTICTVRTPAGTLEGDTAQVSFEVPVQFRQAPFTCKLASGGGFRVTVLTKMPPSEGLAGVTVNYPSSTAYVTFVPAGVDSLAQVTIPDVVERF